MALLRTASPSDFGPVIESERVMLRTPQMSDYPAWAELRASSREFLMPWEPLWTPDELSRASFRRRVRHYLRDLREDVGYALFIYAAATGELVGGLTLCNVRRGVTQSCTCLLYTSDAADDLLCVDLGGRRIIKKKKKNNKHYYH